MNKNEISRAIVTLQVAYPKYYSNMTKESKEATINLWNYQFKDVDGATVLYAIQEFIANDKGYPPTIGQIKEIISNRKHANDKTALEAWDEVMDSIRHRKGRTKEECFNSLDPLTKRIVGTFREYADICSSMENDLIFIKKDFVRRYDTFQKKESEYEKIPGTVKKYIDQLSGKLLINKEDK